MNFQEDLLITAMSSSENEEIILSKTVNPKSKEGEVRGVEDWLNEVEKSMRQSIKDNILNSLKDYYKRKREEWLLLWPA